ncbi:MAG TPA: hypothetical protein VGR30_18910 [Candidatus Binatia bacterium]|jgi:hypothetical protein|nr:hypothetical protein [Candidatus Binatia bacterium]
MSSVFRIELWHVCLLAILLVSLMPFKILEPQTFLLGGGFMALNFFLLGCGVRWVLTPLAGRGRVRAGALLLFLKFLIFIGLLSLLFFRFEVDAISFALGFSTLLVAILVETLYFSLRVGR